VGSPDIPEIPGHLRIIVAPSWLHDSPRVSPSRRRRRRRVVVVVVVVVSIIVAVMAARFRFFLVA
jgi:hypothetical protein